MLHFLYTVQWQDTLHSSAGRVLAKRIRPGTVTTWQQLQSKNKNLLETQKRSQFVAVDADFSAGLSVNSWQNHWKEPVKGARWGLRSIILHTLKSLW